MADDSEQEKYYKRLREKEEREEADKVKRELEAEYEKGQREIEGKKRSTFKFKAKTHLFASFSSALNDIKSGDFKKIFLLPFKLISDLFKLPFIGKIIGWGFVVIVVVLLWSFLFNLFTGGGASIFGTQLSVLSSNIGGPIKAIVNPAVNFFQDPVGTVAQYGTFKSPETVEKRKPQGIEVRNFQTKKPIHRPELDKIETVANVKIYALEDSPTQVKFSCEKEDVVSLKNAATLGYAGGELADRIIISGELENSDSVYVFENQDKSVNVQCEFKEASKIAYDAFGKIDRQKTIQEKITLKANYEDFIVRSRLKVYKLESSALSLIENAGSNPFTEFNIRDPLVSANDRSVRPEQLKSGPVILSLTIIDAQPLTEGLTYLLGIELSNDKLSWNGKISRLKSLKLFFPDGFSPVETRCPDFDRKENNVLELNTPAWTELNRREIDKERFFCDFTIDSSAVTEALDYSLIHAEAKFDYTFEAYTTATISQGLIQSTTTTTKA